MKGWPHTGAHRPLEPASSQVIPDMRGAGPCHSDIGVMDGTLPPMPPTEAAVPLQDSKR